MIKLSYLPSRFHEQANEYFFSNVAEANLYVKYLLEVGSIKTEADASISEVEGDISDYVWCVDCNSRNYDEGDEWLAGIFRTFEKAREVELAELARWDGSNELSVYIYQQKLDAY